MNLKTIKILGVFALLVFLPTACADGSSPEGFCRRWKIFTEQWRDQGRVEKDTLTHILRSNWLGDSYKPLGNLIDEINSGDVEGARDTVASISKRCGE